MITIWLPICQPLENILQEDCFLGLYIISTAAIFLLLNFYVYIPLTPPKKYQRAWKYLKLLRHLRKITLYPLLFCSAVHAQIKPFKRNSQRRRFHYNPLVMPNANPRAGSMMPVLQPAMWATFHWFGENPIQWKQQILEADSVGLPFFKRRVLVWKLEDQRLESVQLVF